MAEETEQYLEELDESTLAREQQWIDRDFDFDSSGEHSPSQSTASEFACAENGKRRHGEESIGESQRRSKERCVSKANEGQTPPSSSQTAENGAKSEPKLTKSKIGEI